MTKKKDNSSKGTRNLINLGDRPVEERKAIAMKGVEAKRKKKQEQVALGKCMKKLLNMTVNKEQKAILKRYGFEDKDLQNKTMLMVVLFRKGLTGDVGAIREITQMMDKLDLFSETGKIEQTVTINLIPQGEAYVPNEEDEKEIYDIENEEWLDETDDEDWGEDIYTGE